MSSVVIFKEIAIYKWVDFFIIFNEAIVNHLKLCILLKVIKNWDLNKEIYKMDKNKQKYIFC